MLLQQIINGIIIGSVYALTAMGATLIYGIMRILDIANAGAYVVGAYIGYYIYITTGNLPLAFILSMGLTGTIGVLVHKCLYGPILAKPHILPIIPLITSVGLFTLTGDLVRLICGAGTKAYNAELGFGAVHLENNIVIAPEWILILVLTAVLFLILWFILNKTTLGLAWKATAEDPEIARAVGINTNSATALSYIIGYGFAAAAGIMVGILYNSITPALGETPSYKMLAIIVLGGLGNPVGTVIAGLFVGLSETLISVYIGSFIPKDSIAFIVLVLILLIKPSGLVSKKLS